MTGWESNSRARPRNIAFTLIELVVGLTIIALLASTLLPVLAKTKPSAHSFQCINNNRQLCAAWRMYADDSTDRMVYSSDDGTGTSNPFNQYAWTLAHMDYSPNNSFNWDTNADIVLRPLWPYTGRDASIYKCPSDQSYLVVGGVPKPRVRSMSMNMFLGGFAGTDGGYLSAHPFVVYLRLSEVLGGKPTPGPSKLWVFLDEREDAINWGNFLTDMDGYGPPSNPVNYAFDGDYPGVYHNLACSFSFADGHVEMHKWSDPRTFPPLGSVSATTTASPRNLDVAWLQAHSTRPK